MFLGAVGLGSDPGMENWSVLVLLWVQMKRFQAEEAADSTKVCTPARILGKLLGAQASVLVLIFNLKRKSDWKLLRQTWGWRGVLGPGVLIALFSSS